MIKSVLRKLAGEKTWSFLSWHRDRYGLLATLTHHSRLLSNNDLAIMPNPLNGAPVFLRPGTTDTEVFEQIFLQQEYDIQLKNVRVIVDAGAHIGLSSIYFALKFPDASVIAIEPESSNFELLKKNTGHYNNITPLQSGLWSHKTRLRIQDQDVATWSFQLTETQGKTGIEAMGIADLMADLNLDHIDLLKIDIEGSELEVLEHSGPWMESVGAMVIELHDRFRPRCSEALEKAIDGFSYKKTTLDNVITLTEMKKITS